MQDFSNHTPMMQQYWQVKSQYMDYILFYRLGDFYEVFYEDAKKVSKLLHLTLTKRGKSNGEEIPMAGIPHHSADSYFARLLKFDEKIAICDQVGEAGKGIIKREITRLITAGTLVEDAFLDAKTDNYLVAISKDKDKFAMAKCVLASGKLEVMEFNSQTEVFAELGKFPVAELLADDSVHWEKPISQISCIRYYPSWHFELRSATEVLLKHFKISDFSSFGLENQPSSIKATGALVHYAQSTQANIEQIDKIAKVSKKNRFALDAVSAKHLEVFASQSGDKRHSLLAVIDKSSTNMGARRIKNWLENPICDRQVLKSRQNAASFLVKNEFLSRLQYNLNQLGDIERIVSRIISQTAKPIDLLYLKRSLKLMPDIKNLLQEILEFEIEKIQKNDETEKTEKTENLTKEYKKPTGALATENLLFEIEAKILNYQNLFLLLNSSISDDAPAIVGSGVIKNGFDEELDKFRNMAENSSSFLQELEEKEKIATGISGLKVGFNRVHGYYIEISRTNAQEDLPAYYTRRQTLKNAERYITPDLKQFEEEVLSAQSKALEREKAIYRQILQKINIESGDLKSTAFALADLDALSSFAFLLKHFNYSLPNFNSENSLQIIQGRHPIVEALSEGPFISNDLILDKKTSMWIITGANMGGKSTFMRQVALIVLLAHIGAPVPAKTANICDIDAIFTRIGASDDLVNNKSTFMVEMSEAAYILRNATKDSLVIMDEIGRGTSTFDGLSLAYAIAQYINKISSYCLFSTHYFELTHIGAKNANVGNYNMTTAKQGADLVFLYKIEKGAASQSYGLEVAKIAGVPPTVIERARDKLKELESIDYRENQPLQGNLFDENLQEIEKQRQENLQLKQQKEIIAELELADLNNLTPMQALELLVDLKSRL